MRRKILMMILISQVAFAQLKQTYKLQNFEFSDLPSGNSVTNLFVCGDTVWIGTSRGLSMTVDGGKTWKNFYRTAEFGENKISAIACKNGITWVALARTVTVDGNKLPEGMGLLYSTDGGKSWFKIRQPVDDRSDTLITYGRYQIKSLPITTTISNITYDIALTGDAIYIASFAGGLRKSTDLGKTWQRIVLPPDNLDEISPDSIKSVFELDPVKNLNHRVFSVIATDDSTIWVGTAGGINLSKDGGKSWVKFSHQNQSFPISGNFVVALGFQSFSSGGNVKNIIWGATVNAEDPDEFKALSFSEDSGRTWQTTLRGEFVHNIAFKDSIVFAVSDNGLWRSTDLGKTWEKAGTIVDFTNRQKIYTNIFYCVGVQSDTLWAGSADGLVKAKIDKVFAERWEIFRTYERVLNTGKVYAYPNPFSPFNEVTRIHYSNDFNETKNVSIEIFDFGMQKIRTIIKNAPREGKREYDEVWDGRNDNGEIVPNGVYFFRVKIGDEEKFGKIILIQ